MEEITPIDPTHAAERRVFEAALAKDGVPFGDLYEALTGEGWYWRKAALVAWMAMPHDERQPRHLQDLANLLGCSRHVLTQFKKRAEVQAAVMRLTTATLFEHKARVDDALITSASNPDYKHNQDRKTYYTLIGALKEQHELTLAQTDDAMRQKSDDELMALAAMADEDDGDSDD